MFKLDRKVLEEILHNSTIRSWHDSDYGKWLASIFAVLFLYAHRARGASKASRSAAEKLVWTIFQCVSEPETERQDAAEHLAIMASNSEYVANSPTPDQQAEDARQLNEIVRKLIVVFGLERALWEALIRMQSSDEPFYTPEYWEEGGRSWLSSEFFPEASKS